MKFGGGRYGTESPGDPVQEDDMVRFQRNFIESEIIWLCAAPDSILRRSFPGPLPRRYSSNSVRLVLILYYKDRLRYRKGPLQNHSLKLHKYITNTIIYYFLPMDIKHTIELGCSVVHPEFETCFNHPKFSF